MRKGFSFGLLFSLILTFFSFNAVPSYATVDGSSEVPEQCYDSDGNYVGDENCANLTSGAEMNENEGVSGDGYDENGEASSDNYVASSGDSETSSKVVDYLLIAFGILLLFTFIMGATDRKVVFFGVLDFLLSLLSFVCFFGSSGVVGGEYAWAEIPLLILGIVLFVRIIWSCILDNRSIVWGLIMSPLKIIISVAVVIYPILWIMEKMNKHSSFHYSASDSRDYYEQRRDFIRGKKAWSAILLALLALLVWICKMCLNGKRVYEKLGWSKDDGWNFKMLVGKGQPAEPAEEE